MQSQKKIHFVNRADRANIGDMVCSPLWYCYDFFQHYTVLRHDIDTIRWLEIGPRDVVIMGGSGMLYVTEGFQTNIRRLYETTPHVVAWSVGFNTHHGRAVTQPVDLTRFSLIGIRDYAHPSGLEYVPCVSCLAPELRKRATIKRRIGVIEHPSFLPIDGAPYEKIGNNANFDALTDFIASSEVILASSYHATFWSLLMGKRTICIPWSSKFGYFKYKPVFYSGNIEKDIAETTVYEDALEDSVRRNTDFFARVKEHVASVTARSTDGRQQRLHAMDRLASLDYQMYAQQYGLAEVRRSIERDQLRLDYASSRLDDMLQRNTVKTVVLCFGTGSMAENILPFLRAEHIDLKACIDERPARRGTTYAGSPVIDFTQIAGCSFDYILVACRPADQICARLRALGVPAEKIVSLDIEELFWQQEDEANLFTALLAHLRRFPGLVHAVDAPGLFTSPWLKNVRNQKQLAVKARSTPRIEGVFARNMQGGELLTSLATPPPSPRLPDMLRSIHIEASNICSYRCFCCSVWNTKRPKGVLSEDSLRILAQRVGPFQGEVALNYCGEPLHDKGLPEKIRMLRQAWPEATLHFVTTLGEDVGEAFLDALWDNGLDRLDVSFYGYTPELYAKIHGVPRYELARKNLWHVLQSQARQRHGGQVRLRVLHVEEQASFLDETYAATAAAFRTEVCAYPGVSSMDMYLMSQAGAGKVRGTRGARLPCSVAWGAFARELYVTWELDVAVCCAVTGDELKLGNLREQGVEEIFSAKPYRDFIRAHWEDNLDAYPFCKRCERHVGGATPELVRVAAWKIANMLQQAKERKPGFSIAGELRLAGPLEDLFRRVPGFVPLASLREAATDRGEVWVFLAASGGAQLALYRELQEDAALAAQPDLRVIPVLGAGFPQSQEIIAALADIYAGLDMTT